MEQIYTARYLVTLLGPPIEAGAVCVRDGRIVAAGRRDAVLRSAPAATRTDFGDAVLLPPLVNAHTHLELTDFPRWARETGEEEPATFVDWILRVVRVKRGVKLEAYLPSLAEGIRRSLRAGTGAVGDILSCFPARRGYAGAPLMGRLYLETLGRDPSVNRQLLRGLGSILDESPPGAVRWGLSPHSPYTLSAEYLEDVYDFARRRRLPSAIHLAESPDETAFVRDSGGPLADILYPFVGWQKTLPPPARRTPVAYLAERGGLVPSSLLVHGVQVSTEDARLLADSGATVVLCPRSNARLGVGTAPVETYLRARIPMALGTDSLASCDSLSVWDEVAFARALFAGTLAPAELLAMATVGGARALGLSGELGTLQAGAGAHFQVLTPPVLPPLAELEEFLCAPGRTSEVSALYLGGRDVLHLP